METESRDANKDGDGEGGKGGAGRWRGAGEGWRWGMGRGKDGDGGRGGGRMEMGDGEERGGKGREAGRGSSRNRERGRNTWMLRVDCSMASGSLSPSEESQNEDTVPSPGQTSHSLTQGLAGQSALVCTLSSSWGILAEFNQEGNCSST